MRWLVVVLLAAGCGQPSADPFVGAPWLGSQLVKHRVHHIELLIGGLGSEGPVLTTTDVDFDAMIVTRTQPTGAQTRQPVTADQRDRLLQLASAVRRERPFDKDRASDYIERITITDSEAFEVWNAGPLRGTASAPLEAMLQSLGG